MNVYVLETEFFKFYYLNVCILQTRLYIWLKLSQFAFKSVYKNRKRLPVPCYFLAPCDKRKHTVHAYQQAASQTSTDSAWRHPVWLPHSSLGFQRPVGRRSYRLTPQSTRLWLIEVIGIVIVAYVSVELCAI